MTDEEVSTRLLAFIRRRFLDGDPGNELDETVPLLEWGLLSSLSTVLLLAFIRDDLGVGIPREEVNSRNFRDIRSIAALVARHRQAA